MPICYWSTKSHLVLVSWSTGLVESLDGMPGRGLELLPRVTSAAYIARAGTLSTLEPVDADTIELLGADRGQKVIHLVAGLRDHLVLAIERIENLRR